MGLESVSTDLLERQLVANRELEARLHAVNLEILEELDRRQVAAIDGCRSLVEWVASRLDVGPETARKLVSAMRRTADRPWLRRALADGVSLDRVEALSRIEEEPGRLHHLDVSGVRREAALRRRVTPAEEHRSVRDRFLVLQPSLDESWWRIWGGLDAVSGAVVDTALTEAADSLPSLPDGTRGDGPWRRATALVELCVGSEPPPAQVTVFVDARHGAATGGQAGTVLEAGPRAGRLALQAVLCDSTVEVTARTEDGRYLEYGRRIRTTPPALRRAILHRDGNGCAADGCQSRYRLQIHHLVPWSEGGTTEPDNMVTLCWYHHQVVVHQLGYTPYRHPDHGRLRFRRPRRGPPD
jgi:hypothetical protein